MCLETFFALVLLAECLSSGSTACLQTSCSKIPLTFWMGYSFPCLSSWVTLFCSSSWDPLCWWCPVTLSSGLLPSSFASIELILQAKSGSNVLSRPALNRLELL